MTTRVVDNLIVCIRRSPRCFNVGFISMLNIEHYLYSTCNDSILDEMYFRCAILNGHLFFQSSLVTHPKRLVKIV